MSSQGGEQSGSSLNSLVKIPSGINGLDEITHGGLPKGRPIIVCGNTGCGKTLLSMQFLVKGALDYGDPGVFMAFEESEQDLCQNVSSLGWDIAELQNNNMLVIDQVEIDHSMLQETGDFSLEGIFLRLDSAINEIGAKRVVLDTIETLFGGLANSAIVRRELHRLFQWLKSRGVTTIITAERGETGLSRYGVEEYVSDCVLLLDNRIENELATRRMWIVKYRGSEHGSNEYPFLISNQGFSVLPITSLEMDHPVSDERISTGFLDFDEMLSGLGYFRGSSIMVSGNPGSGKTIVALHFIYAACQRGERCLFFSYEESPAQLLRNMLSVGLDLKPFVDTGLLLFYSTRNGAYGLEMHLACIYDRVLSFNPKNIVFDPINGMTAEGDFYQTKSFLTRLIDFLKSKNITALFVKVEEEERPKFLGISSIMDTWVRLLNNVQNGELNRLLYLMKSRGMSHSNQAREFFISSQGILLEEIYTGPEGVVTGSARKSLEAKDKAEFLNQKQEIEKLNIILQNQRKIFETRIQSLNIEQSIEIKELETQVDQAKRKANILSLDRVSMAELRGDYNDKI